MNILHLTSEYPPYIFGGLGIHVTNLTRALNEINSVRVTVCSWSYPNAVESDYIQPLDVTEYHASGLFSYGIPKSGHEIVLCNFGMVAEVINSKGEFDVIHAHDFTSGFAGLTLSKILSLPLVTTFHDTVYSRLSATGAEVDRMNDLFIDTQKGLLKESSAIIAVSNSLKSEIDNNFGQIYKCAKVIPNGINGPTHVKETYELSGNPKLLYVGRINPIKGLADLIESISMLHKDGIKVELTIVGAINDYAEELKRLARFHGVEHYTFFKGFLSGSELTQTYLNSDFAIVPSHYEPFGIVPLEACSLGLPVIVSSVGGLAENFVNNIDALLFPTRNPEALSAACKRLIGDVSLRKRLGTSSRQKVLNKFSWETTARMTYELYQSVIKDVASKIGGPK